MRWENGPWENGVFWMALLAEWTLVYGMFMVDINVDIMNYIYHSDLVYKRLYSDHYHKRL